MSETFFWHDYETWGANPRRDRPAQFAGIRTDRALEPVEEPVSFLCRPALDCLPDPGAVLITGIAPEDALREGLPEAEFAGRIFEALARPGTCAVGYNSFHFDDEVTRFLLYRNFFPPYAREFGEGRSRWDLIDVARLCYALRPGGMRWPEHEPGRPSFRLEDLASANGLAHGRAHDALSDVEATIALARRLRAAQPRLFDWCLELRERRRVLGLLDVVRREPVVHVSSRFPAERGCLALVLPLALHPKIRSQVIVVDLAADPTALLEADVELLRELVFTPAADLPEGLERVPLKTIAVNRAPVLAPRKVLRGVDLARIRLDPERCLEHARRLRADPGLAERVRAVYGCPWSAEGIDPEDDLYGGLLPGADVARFPALRSAPPETLDAETFPFQDRRLATLLGRYRARNHPDSLDDAARDDWFLYCRARWKAADEASGLPACRAMLAKVHQLRGSADGPRQALLDRYERWLRERADELALAL